jgi:hypothetical protein
MVIETRDQLVRVDSMAVNQRLDHEIMPGTIR